MSRSILILANITLGQYLNTLELCHSKLHFSVEVNSLVASKQGINAKRPRRMRRMLELSVRLHTQNAALHAQSADRAFVAATHRRSVYTTSCGPDPIAVPRRRPAEGCRIGLGGSDDRAPAPPARQPLRAPPRALLCCRLNVVSKCK